MASASSALSRCERRRRRRGDGGRSGAAAGILLRATLTRFGGKGVTNLWVGRGESELADVTVSFGARVPFWAETVALFADTMSREDIGRLTEIIGQLGVPVHESGNALVAPKRQLRARMTVDDQIAAYAAARAAGYDAALIRPPFRAPRPRASPRAAPAATRRSISCSRAASRLPIRARPSMRRPWKRTSRRTSARAS